MIKNQELQKELEKCYSLADTFIESMRLNIDNFEIAFQILANNEELLEYFYAVHPPNYVDNNIAYLFDSKFKKDLIKTFTRNNIEPTKLHHRFFYVRYIYSGKVAFLSSYHPTCFMDLKGFNQSNSNFSQMYFGNGRETHPTIFTNSQVIKDIPLNVLSIRKKCYFDKQLKDIINTDIHKNIIIYSCSHQFLNQLCDLELNKDSLVLRSVVMPTHRLLDDYVDILKNVKDKKIIGLKLELGDLKYFQIRYFIKQLEPFWNFEQVGQSDLILTKKI